MSHLTKLWANNDTAGLRRLAQEIEAQGTWRGYLTPTEHELFKTALEQRDDTWDRLVNGEIECFVDSSYANGSVSSPRVSATPQPETPRPGQALNGNAGEKVQLDSLTVAFRIRYMLYDKSVGVLFMNPNAPQEFDYSILESEEDKAEAKAPAPPVRRVDEDDYDDDDEEDEEEEQDNKPDETNESNDTNNSNEPLVVKATITKSDDEPKKNKQVLAQLNRLYHIFEGDAEAAAKQKKLEESDRQVDNDVIMDAESGKPNSSTAAFGAANLSLKHLLAVIEDKRDQLQLNDQELKSLISDVRKNRSKWASEDKIGQEELYEAAEKVVLELRGYTEHSTAFLNKVNKRDAPNYFNVIKHPMDLNTVMKKLKGFQYKSKKEFVNDIMLIWDNCFTYNTDPNHFLRVHAHAMKRKTENLIPLIPDIVIRDRAEVEAEEKQEEANMSVVSNGEEQGEEEEGEEKLMRTSSSAPSSSKGGKHSSKGRKRKIEELSADGPSEDAQRGEKSPAPASFTALGTPGPESRMSRASPFPSHLTNSIRTPRVGTPGFGSQASGAAGSGEYYEQLDEDEHPPYELDVQTEVWQTVMTKPRAKYYTIRSSLFNGNKLNADAETPVRRAELMNRFEEAIKNIDENASADGSQGVRGAFSRRKWLESLDIEKKDPFIPDYEVTSGVPELPRHLDIEQIDIDESVRNIEASDIKPSDYVARYGLQPRVLSNLAEMQQIRKICSKIALIRQMQQQAYLHNTTVKQYNPPEIVETDLDLESRLPNRDKFDHAASRAALKRSVAKMAMHTGFEVTEPMAINALTEIAADYMSKLTRTLTLLMESNVPGDAYSYEDILVMALQRNGIETVGSLESYVRDDIERHGTRLQDLREKLTSFLGELLRPGVNDLNDQQFQDDSEQFLNGDFSEQIGEDFFGFKELGLDKELGLLTSSVPLHLLHTRFHASLMDNADTNDIIDRGSIIEEYQPMTREYALKQLSILQPFYLSRLEHSKNTTVLQAETAGVPVGETVLLEGEQLPPKLRNTRPKVPPTGKITNVKKKPKARAFFIPEKLPEPKSEAPTEPPAVPKPPATDDDDLLAMELSAAADDSKILNDNIDSLF
ncbi:transcriptional activator Spt7p [Trichomonascus vanleenenianus]|uniref:SAGA histone acetyltransferase complex subunit SPT7 n=1 Tax=Trichomonascus vanleenenianus TaxID=2268995 RepID=UPI003EC98EFA